MPISSRFKTPITIISVVIGATVITTLGYRLIYANNPFGEIFSVSQSVINPNSVQRQLLNKQKVAAPDIQGITQWLNTRDGTPISLADLRGKVVLVDFWTYSCINCIRTLPYLVEWDKKYRDQGLVIIGVHTPEFNFEKDPGNVLRAIADYGIAYPVALDNDYKTWRAYNNHYWPAKYFVDHEGNIVWQHFGEGSYEESERVIQQLLQDAGLLKEPVATVEPAITVDFDQIRTPEIYFGYKRIDHFGQTVVGDRAFDYSAPTQPRLNTFYLDGTWEIGSESAKLTSERGKIVIRYSAKQANIVLESSSSVTGTIRIDGKTPTIDQLGKDVTLVNGEARVEIHEPRLYTLTTTESYGEHVLEVELTAPGVTAFAFTFG